MGIRKGNTVQLRNVSIFSISQTLAMSGVAMVALLGGIIGTELAPSPVWATLPVSAMVVGGALSTIPAALLMKRIGRRRGFMSGAVLGGLAALLAARALTQSSFMLFCAATVLIGAGSAFVQQYRFAAAESVENRFAGRAVSFVLLGGIMAGVLGPEIGKRTIDWLEVTYAGSFITIALLYVAVGVLLSFLHETASLEAAQSGEQRPLSRLALQPNYIVAVLASAVAYGVMSLVMTATPVELHSLQGYSLDQTAWIIQSHILGMYVPSLFTGFVLDRLGVSRVMNIGVGCLVTSVTLALLSRELTHYWGALVLLGIGWNLLFLGGTVLLTRSYRPAERFKAQAANDFIVFGVRAISSLSAGAVLYSTTWDVLNLISIPFLLLTLAALRLLHRQLALAPSEA